MRVILLISSTTLLMGCAEFFHRQTAGQDCQQASHALRVHDSKIAAASRLSESTGFIAPLASRGYNTYHCSTVSGNQIACSTIMPSLKAADTAHLNRLMRERNGIEARAARACRI
jgi:hypothetical protein